jgi:hypothetical protein
LINRLTFSKSINKDRAFKEQKKHSIKSKYMNKRITKKHLI